MSLRAFRDDWRWLPPWLYRRAVLFCFTRCPLWRMLFMLDPTIQADLDDVQAKSDATDAALGVKASAAAAVGNAQATLDLADAADHQAAAAVTDARAAESASLEKLIADLRAKYGG